MVYRLCSNNPPRARIDISYRLNNRILLRRRRYKRICSNWFPRNTVRFVLFISLSPPQYHFRTYLVVLIQTPKKKKKKMENKDLLAVSLLPYHVVIQVRAELARQQL